jgi:hypothetical protein
MTDRISADTHPLNRRYEPIDSNFQVTVSVWLPERVTVVFGASVKTTLLLEQDVTSAAQMATVLYAELLSVPVLPTAFAQVAAFQLTSPAAQVGPPGEVKVEALACRETRSCLLAVARTMLLTVTAADGAAVLDATLTTLKLTFAGTVTRACSLTLAVKVVDWLVSGRDTGVCADAPAAIPTTKADASAGRTHALHIKTPLLPLGNPWDR